MHVVFHATPQTCPAEMTDQHAVPQEGPPQDQSVSKSAGPAPFDRYRTFQDKSFHKLLPHGAYLPVSAAAEDNKPLSFH